MDSPPSLPGTSDDRVPVEDEAASGARPRSGFAPDPEWLARHRRGELETPLPHLGAERLVRLDLAGLDLRGLEAAGADFSRCDLTGANLFGARLQGAIFFGARLDEAELGKANLVGANLEGVRARRAGFGHADLGDARLSGSDFEGASFTGACLDGASGIGVSLRGARLREATLRGAEFPRSDFRAADLTGLDVDRANFSNVDLRDAQVGEIEGYESAHWIGADVRDVDCSHAYGFRRFVADQNFLHEFALRNPVLHRVWLVSCDCGRSLGRWSAWTMLLTLVYALAYTAVDVDYGADPTWFSPIYYSVVTMTTLGYGDVTPSSVPAQILAVSQAILGYVMLGGMLSILSQKLARRAE